jgi:hypothetical protein
MQADFLQPFWPGFYHYSTLLHLPPSEDGGLNPGLLRLHGQWQSYALTTRLDLITYVDQRDNYPQSTESCRIKEQVPPAERN